MHYAVGIRDTYCTVIIIPRIGKSAYRSFIESHSGDLESIYELQNSYQLRVYCTASTSQRVLKVQKNKGYFSIMYGSTTGENTKKLQKEKMII